MAEMTLNLPDGIAQEIARRAAALGTTPERWVASIVQDVAADLPEDAREGPDDWIAR